MKRLTPAASAFWLIFVAVLVHALWVKVLPAPVFYTWPIAAPCLVLGLAFTAWRWRVQRREGFAFRSGLLAAFAFLITPFCMAALVWLVCAKTVPWTAAVLSGSPHAESHAFEMKLGRGIPCRYRVVPVRLRDFGPVANDFCVSADYFHQHRDNIVLIRLVGERTSLGFRVTHTEHQSVLGPRALERQ